MVRFHQRITSDLGVAAQHETCYGAAIPSHLDDSVSNRALLALIQQDVTRLNGWRVDGFYSQRVAVTNRGCHARAVCTKPHAAPDINQIASDLEERSRVVSERHLRFYRSAIDAPIFIKSNMAEPLRSAAPVRPHRVSLAVAARYRPVGEGAWHMGRTENISQTGVLLRGIRLFSPNDRVEILMTVPAGIVTGAVGEMLFIGKVARLVPPPIGGGLPGIAIAFEKYRPAGPTVVRPASTLPPSGPT